MQFSLRVLGSSAAIPSSRRSCSAHLLRSERTAVLIDCGEGTLRQLQIAHEGYGSIDLVLISHLHGDHYFGLPGLLTSLGLNQRRKPLTVVSPPGLEARIGPLLELDRYPLPFELHFHELPPDWLDPHAEDAGPELLTELKDIEVLAFPLQHRVPTSGYLLRERPRLPNLRSDMIRQYQIPVDQLKGIKEGRDFRRSDGLYVPHHELVTPAKPPRAFAYCSDTAYLPPLAQWLHGVDLLYHEATFTHDLLDKAIQTGHSTARQAATIARDAGVGRLLLGHFSTRYSDTDKLVEEARDIFSETEAAVDLGLWEI